MLELAQEARREFSAITEQQFMASRVYQTSLAWYLQSIGEAASRISEPSRLLIPDVPWKQIVGTRHILAHEYDKLAPSKLWRVLTLHLDPMIAALQTGLSRLPK